MKTNRLFIDLRIIVDIIIWYSLYVMYKSMYFLTHGVFSFRMSNNNLQSLIYHYMVQKMRNCIQDGGTTFWVNFIYSEKATKFWEIFPLLLTTVHAVKSKGNISQNFVAFLEYMNFTTVYLARIRKLLCRDWLHGNINLLIFSELPHTRGLSFQGDFKVNYPKFVYVDKVTIRYLRTRTMDTQRLNP